MNSRSKSNCQNDEFGLDYFWVREVCGAPQTLRGRLDKSSTGRDGQVRECCSCGSDAAGSWPKVGLVQVLDVSPSTNIASRVAKTTTAPAISEADTVSPLRRLACRNGALKIAPFGTDVASKGESAFRMEAHRVDWTFPSLLGTCSTVQIRRSRKEPKQAESGRKRALIAETLMIQCTTLLFENRNR